MNWVVMKSLNELYINGETKAKISVKKDDTIQFLMNSTHEIILYKNIIKVPENSTFPETYRNLYEEDYKNAERILIKYDLKDPYVRFSKKDFSVLSFIEKKMENGELQILREQIIKAKESVRGVSLMFFRNDKYLDNREKLTKAVETILNVPPLPSGKDKQYLYVLPCNNPTKIVLCENLNFLNLPELVRPHNIELWYAGGYNVKMLDQVDLKGLSIYYSCDWDYDGLRIYEIVKRLIPEITLLTPNGTPKNISETDHKSQWVSNSREHFLEGNDLLDNNQKNILENLILNDEWIIEESNDLIEMIPFETH